MCILQSIPNILTDTQFKNQYTIKHILALGPLITVNWFVIHAQRNAIQIKLYPPK